MGRQESTISENKNPAKRAARERLAEERVREAASRRRRRNLTVVGVAVAVLAAAGVTGYLVQNSRSAPSRHAAPAGTTGQGDVVVPVGNQAAKATLTIYEDPRCPACGEFEKDMHTTINRLEKAGKVKIQYHVVSFIDRHDNGTGSKNAANALGCAQTAGRFHDYHDVLYANQPEETDDAWADQSRLTALAKRVPGLSTPAFDACVAKAEYAGWVSGVEENFDKSGYSSTPTVLLNGTSAFPTYNGEQISPATLTKWVEAADAA
ncbi:DsbA family protein [Phaeacidiphilus oryzae]|uniref:DsbA family protein n=1 Tax=Phaeacidiphilus oryzae TaxID=348818 RepID=UPI000690E2C8|nr:thioredoxin domain-containing protein [Phaeacidiphilus oryzae]